MTFHHVYAFIVTIFLSLVSIACGVSNKQAIQADRHEAQLQQIYDHLGVEKMGWQENGSLIICGFDRRVLDGPRTILAATRVIYSREKKVEPATVVLLPLPDVDPGWSCAQASPAQ